MATGKPFRSGPAFLAAAAANIYNPSANTYAVLRHIHLFNTNIANRAASLYIGATGGSANGTEIFEGLVILPNAEKDYYCATRMDVADFLTGLSSVDGTSVTITIDGELYAL